MIDSQLKRICGIHVEEDGTLGAVWLGHDLLDDSIHLYDSCKFTREVPIVIAEGLNARGRWIPIAWHKSAEAFVQDLSKRGCRMLFDGSNDTGALAEAISRDIWERMRTHRFKVDKRLMDWREENKAFDKKDSKIPTDNFPLMAATRHAMSQLNFARRQASKKKTQRTFPKVAIV
jgi:hypothetical protein